MPNIQVVLTKKQISELKVEADKLGLSISSYIRMKYFSPAAEEKVGQ